MKRLTPLKANGDINMKKTRKIDDEVLLQKLKNGEKQYEIAEHFRVSPAAISKRLKKLLPPPESLQKLTERQKLFCTEVAGGKTQTQAVMKSYEVGSLESAKVIGSQLMTKPEIQTAISDLMEYHGLTRSYRVQRLKNHVDNRDPGISLKALDQSWKLDGAYLERRVNYNVNYEDINKGLAEIDAEIAKLEGKTIEVECEVIDPKDDENNNGKN